MKGLFLLTIRLYWLLVPEGKRRRCLFRISCARYVYQTTQAEGCCEGLAALRFRFRNCRGGFHLFDDPVGGGRKMVLPGGTLIADQEIAERLLKDFPCCPEQEHQMTTT